MIERSSLLDIIGQKLPLIIVCFMVWMVAKWQLEIVWIYYWLGRAYDFAGFGSFGIPIWNWRDIWWCVEVIVIVGAIYFISQVSYEVGKEEGCECLGSEEEKAFS